MQIHVARPVVVARVTLADAVREGTATGNDKALATRPAPVVVIAVVPRHTTAHLQLVLLLVADVQRGRFRLALSVVIATSTTTAS